jgi:phage repressor protein C with HTH and peptisase S24 domain
MREWHEESEESAPDFISRRVLGLLKERKAKLAPFARGLGIDPALFRRFLKGKRRWRMDYLEKVAEGFGMSLEELLTGPKPQPEVLQPVISLVGKYDQPPEGLIVDDYFAVPMVDGNIAAGHAGAIPGDFITSMVWVYKPEIGKRKHHNLRAVKLANNANSMEPTIRRGSIVIIDPTETAIHKRAIYAVRLEQYEGACAIKRVRENGEFWFFLSDNPEWEPIVMKKERDHNPIIGRVIWSWTSWVK